MEFKSLKDFVRIVENSLAVQFYGLPGGSVSVLRKTVLKVLAAVLGGCLYMLSLVEKRIWRNRFVTTCEVSALDGFGVEYGCPHKVPLAATGYARVTLAAGASSATIPQGTILVDSSSNVEYEVTFNSVVTSSARNVAIKAVVPGFESNIDDGVSLTFRDGDIAGVASMASLDVSGGVLFKVEIDGNVQDWGETAEDYRARLVNRVQNPVSGANKNEYWRQATRFQFVTDAFVIPNEPNANSVSVAIANFYDQNISVAEDKVSEVRFYMTDEVRREIGADVRVFSVTPSNVEINAKITPYSDAVKDSVTAAITQFMRKAAPGRTVFFDDLILAVRSNSLAQTFAITSVKKGGNVVSNIALALSVPSDPSEDVTAEVAKCTVNLTNGGT